VADQVWSDYGNSTTVDEFQYGYDAAGNVLCRTNAVDSAMSEFYRYNDLGELTDFQRGASQAPVGQGANEEQYTSTRWATSLRSTTTARRRPGRPTSPTRSPTSPAAW
jgi:YD repeat-containing protein